MQLDPKNQKPKLNPFPVDEIGLCPFLEHDRVRCWGFDRESEKYDYVCIGCWFLSKVRPKREIYAIRTG